MIRLQIKKYKRHTRTWSTEPCNIKLAISNKYGKSPARVKRQILKQARLKFKKLNNNSMHTKW